MATGAKLGVVLTVVLAISIGASQEVHAIELLSAGNFEATIPDGGPEVPEWTLEEYVSGNPSLARDSAGLAGFADNPIDPLNINGDHRGLWLKSFNGDPDPGLVDAILTQVVTGAAGETYTFSGQAAFETNYAGGVTTLDTLSPWGAIPSPTKTEFELAFLDAGGSVIGSPFVRDLATEVFNGFGYTAVTPITETAPAGTVSVRVRAMGRDLADAGLNPQSAFVDNFSLTAQSAPTTELLANADLNTLPPVPPTVEELLDEVWDFVETPDGVNSLAMAGFANDPSSGGSNGVWIRPFVADSESAVVRQIVEGVAGTEYNFSASARWEVNYLGDGGGGENETLLELAFLDGSGSVIDSVVLDLRADGQTADNGWHSHSLSSVAPAGTAQVSVSGIVNNLTDNTENGNNQSAFWDDFSLMADVGGLAGDFNGDGKVDAADYTVWRDSDGPQSDYLLWRDNYGAVAAEASAAASSAPEPAAAMLFLAAVLATGVASRRPHAAS